TADNLADDTISITTGSGATSITGTANPTPDVGPGELVDTVAVNANALGAAGLTLSGGDLFSVSKTNAGSLTIQTVGLAATTTLTLSGDANYTVNNLVADLVDTGTGTL